MLNTNSAIKAIRFALDQIDVLYLAESDHERMNRLKTASGELYSVLEMLRADEAQAIPKQEALPL